MQAEHIFFSSVSTGYVLDRWGSFSREGARYQLEWIPTWEAQMASLPPPSEGVVRGTSHTILIDNMAELTADERCRIVEFHTGSFPNKVTVIFVDGALQRHETSRRLTSRHSA